jgi:hypothetical protein
MIPPGALVVATDIHGSPLVGPHSAQVGGPTRAHDTILRHIANYASFAGFVYQITFSAS